MAVGHPLSVTIPSGQALSGAANLETLTLVGIVMPAAWTAANLTFQGSVDGVAYSDLYDSAGQELQVTAAAGRFIVLDPKSFVGVRYVKVRSGTAAAPVNQAAARTLTLLARPIAG